MGGITTGRDALEFLAAGASAIGLGTVLFADPDAPGRVRRELAEELASRGLSAADDATGLAHSSGPVTVA
jgi:dihydroorotate dehydrogenase (NAD+) catalytic subunit